MALSHVKITTLLAAVLLAMSCFVFMAPGLQAESAEETASEEVVVEPEEETAAETTEEIADEPEDTVTEVAVTEDLMTDAPQEHRDNPPSAPGDRPAPSDDARPEGPGHRDAPGRDMESQIPEEHSGSDGLMVFGSEMRAGEEEEPEFEPMVFDFPRETFRPSGPVTVTVVDEALMHQLFYEMLLSPIELTDDTDLFEPAQDDGEEPEEADTVPMAEAEESDPEEDAPETVPEPPGEPPELPCNSFSDILRSHQVVANLS